jgi:hypothetical protein
MTYWSFRVGKRLSVYGLRELTICGRLEWSKGSTPSINTRINPHLRPLASMTVDTHHDKATTSPRVTFSFARCWSRTIMYVLMGTRRSRSSGRRVCDAMQTAVIYCRDSRLRRP